MKLFITGITREINGTKSFAHSVGSLVYKYELNGVSLLRINKTHDLSDASITDQIGLDYYYLKVDMTAGTNTTDRTGSGFQNYSSTNQRKLVVLTFQQLIMFHLNSLLLQFKRLVPNLLLFLLL